MPRSKILTLALCCGSLLCSTSLNGASLLSATPGSIALSCDTAAGPGPAATIVVKPVATLSTNTFLVTLGPVAAGLIVTPPASTILNAASQTQGLSYSVKVAPGCAGATTGATTIRFLAGGIADVSVTATTSVTASASPLAVSPLIVTCVRNSGPPVVYSSVGAQIASITSAAAGGTPFTVDVSTVPPWLSVVPAANGVANLTGTPLSLLPIAPCGNYLTGTSTPATIHLRNAPAPDGVIPVTLQILGPSPLTASPGAPSLSYVKGSDTPAFVDVMVASSGPASFTVDPGSLPAWLSVNFLNGSTPKTLRFSTTSLADSTAQGTYSAAVRVQVSGAGDLTIPFRLAISSPAPKLVVEEGIARNLSWTLGQPLPVAYITLASSGSAIPYVLSTAGPLAPIIGSGFLKGFAYSYDTPVPVTFSPSVFATAQAGDTLAGTVTITWGPGASTTVIALTLIVQPAAATLSGVTPSSLPTAGPGESFVVALSGSGFAANTVVGIVSSGALVSDSNIAALILNPSNILLTITVPAVADPFLPFGPASTGGVINLGVCNPLGAATACITATGTAKLTINPNPMIQGVTSASAFVQVSSPTLPTVAPYDMISVFGTSLCSLGGTGCATDQVLYGRLDPATLRYPLSLSPDPVEGAQRALTVGFQTRATPPVAIANAPLLFATDEQINLLVPSAVASYAGKSVDLVVNFGTSSSAPFSVNVAAADPGIFTLGTDGQGEGAILSLDGSVITAGNEAAMRANAVDSDIVQVFMTGLGAPDGIADNAGPGAGQWPADCVTNTSYLLGLNSQTSGSLLTLDGSLIPSSLLNTGRLAPCMHSSAAVPTVTIGGQPATLMYAGWAPDQLAGLYQLNVKLPGSTAGPFTSASGATLSGPLTAPVQLPVLVTVRGHASQAGVTVWVAPKLRVVGPAGAALRGTAGTAWPSGANAVTASQGRGPYRYALTGGSLANGLVLNAATGAISGIPSADSAGSYTLTVTATDSAARPLTGSVTFTILVASAH